MPDESVLINLLNPQISLVERKSYYLILGCEYRDTGGFRNLPKVIELWSGGIKSEQEQTSFRICICKSSLYQGCGKLAKKQDTRIVTLTWSRLEIKMDQRTQQQSLIESSSVNISVWIMVKTVVRRDLAVRNDGKHLFDLIWDPGMFTLKERWCDCQKRGWQKSTPNVCVCPWGIGLRKFQRCGDKGFSSVNCSAFQRRGSCSEKARRN